MSEVNNIIKDLNRLVVYRNILKDKVIGSIADILNNYDGFSKDDLEGQFYKIYGDLVVIGDQNGYIGDLWKSHIVKLVMEDENVFSLGCEKNVVNSDNSLYKLAVQDLNTLKGLYNLNLYGIFGSNFGEYKGKAVVDKYKALKQYFEEAGNAEELVEKVKEYYSNYGCGILSKHYAFRYEEGIGLIGIDNLDKVRFEHLIGCDIQKNTIIENTEAFLQDAPSNNALLYGDKGTGKSSSIKALINEFGPKGLRLIEINRHQLSKFQKVVDLVKDRGLHFIIFMDDLSFEEFETDYKYLKSVIEGGIEAKPSNVLVYATTNRRHLIKENWKDRGDSYDEISTSESMQEKLSLVDRFGVTVIFSSPNQNEYLNIVEGIAKRYDLGMTMEEIKQEALKWALWHNGRSGRTAQQFINHLAGLHKN